MEGSEYIHIHWKIISLKVFQMKHIHLPCLKCQISVYHYELYIFIFTKIFSGSLIWLDAFNIRTLQVFNCFIFFLVSLFRCMRTRPNGSGSGLSGPSKAADLWNRNEPIITIHFGLIRLFFFQIFFNVFKFLKFLNLFMYTYKLLLKTYLIK